MAEQYAERLEAIPLTRARTFAQSATGRIVAWWAVSRLVVFGAAAVLQWIDKPRGYFYHGFKSPLEVLASWDGRWYEQVARHGYLLIPGHQSDPAFFPLYPALLRLVSATGLTYTDGGIVISNLLLLGGLIAFYRLGREFLPERDAYRATVLAALTPMGFAFSMAYPESLVFGAMALAGLAALRQRWLLCGACGAAAALARPQGALVLLPVAAAAAHVWPRLEPRARGLAAAAVAAPLAALLSFPLYLGDVLGDPHAWSKAQQAWGRSFQLDGFVRAFGQLPARNGTDHWLLRDALFCLVFVVLLALAWRAGIPLAWVVAGALMVLLPLETGSFISVARFGLLALPVFWGAAVLARRPAIDWGLRILSVGLLVAFVITLPLIFP
jgi:hypothetical protein